MVKFIHNIISGTKYRAFWTELFQLNFNSRRLKLFSGFHGNTKTVHIDYTILFARGKNK